MNQRLIRKSYRNISPNVFSIIVPIFLCVIFFITFTSKKHEITHKKSSTPYVTTNGKQLILNGKPYSFIGYNMYYIASLPGHNVGCGGDVKDIDSFFAKLPSRSVIRIWAWQGSMAINPTTKQLDWTGIDRVLAAAKKYNQKIIISLGTQSGECDDGQWKDSQWYSSGYKYITNTSGLTPLSYWQYIHKIVSRYKKSQTIAMWELINEPETSDCNGYTGAECYTHQTCPDHEKAAVILRNFFDTVGKEVKKIDSNHLVESGLIGTGQCGSDNANYLTLHKSPAIDVASYHDYNDNEHAIPGDQWNGLAVRIQQMKTVNKPLIVGELGMTAVKDGGNCLTLQQRKAFMQNKVISMLSKGVSGILIWNRSEGEDTDCNFDIGNNDPVVQFINSYKLPY